MSSRKSTARCYAGHVSHRLPPLNALRAFEAAARHLRFTRAASELYLTRGAVAQQVRKLEEALRQKLFHVRSNRLTLTTAGERFLPHVTLAFRTISKAAEEIAPALKGRVFRLGVAPELISQNYRLAQALRAPPRGLRLRLVKTHDLSALREDAADAILRPATALTLPTMSTWYRCSISILISTVPDWSRSPGWLGAPSIARSCPCCEARNRPLAVRQLLALRVYLGG